MPEPLRAAGGAIRAALAAKPYDPPSRQVLAPDPVSARALRFLIDSGDAVEVGAEVVLGADSFVRATELIRRYIQEHGPATLGDLRSALGSTRRVMLPLLDHLDRRGVTLRQGDRRTLRT